MTWLLALVLAYQSVPVPALSYQGQHYLTPRALIRAFHLRHQGKGVYRRGGHQIAFGTHKIWVDGKAFRVRSHRFPQEGLAYEARSLEPAVSRWSDRQAYWDLEKKRFILSRYRPSIQKIRASGTENTCTLEIQHNRDLRPRVSLRGDTLRLRVPRGFYAGPLPKVPSWLRTVQVGHTLRGFLWDLVGAAEARVETPRPGQSVVRISRRPSAPAPPAAGPTPVLKTAPRDHWVVVIDPGHGGKDPGAIGRRGTREKDITLAVARRLKRILEASGKVRVILTRDRDRFITLGERARIANRAHADLFVSLHCNKARSRSAKGAETYFLSAARTQWERAVANLENGALRFEGVQPPDTTGDLVAYVLSDMAQAQFLKESQQLALAVQTQLARALNLRDRGVKQAGFYVLTGAYMPAILVEMGFLSNRQEENLLRQGWYQEKLAKAIARGILNFLRQRSTLSATGARTPGG